MNGIERERNNSVSVITFDDGRVNVLTTGSISALTQALTDSALDSAAVVVAGRPGCLSAGLDRDVMLHGERPARSALYRAVTEMFLAMMSMPIPLVMACTGHAVAGGAALLLAADERIGATGPWRVGLTEVELGLPLPSYVIAAARVRLLPTALVRATAGAVTYPPEGALACGYLDETHPPDQVVARAVEQAERLGALPREAFVATRQAVWAPAMTEIAAARKARRPDRRPQRSDRLADRPNHAVE